MLAYLKFGKLNNDTISLLQQFLINIEKETFEKECSTLYKNLCIIEEKHKDEINKNPRILGAVLSEGFITVNYRYILGTLLAIYAQKYSNFNDIVNLNNHINEYENMSVYDICLSIGIDYKDENFKQNLFTAIDEYINTKQSNYKNEK